MDKGLGLVIKQRKAGILSENNFPVFINDDNVALAVGVHQLLDVLHLLEQVRHPDLLGSTDVDAGLDARQVVLFIEGDDAFHPAHVDRHDG